jgi:16S rRNA processing protein RimM
MPKEPKSRRKASASSSQGPDVGREDPKFLVVGHLNKPHGTKGELFVWPLTDHPESVYAPGASLFIGDGDARAPELDVAPLRIEGVRPFRKGYLVAFEGVSDRDAAERLRGRYLVSSIDTVQPLEPGELFYHQLLGMRVRTTEGTDVGEIVEVYELHPAHLLQVKGATGEVMVPFLSDVVVEVDVKDRLMVINPPEGLLDL